MKSRSAKKNEAREWTESYEWVRAADRDFFIGKNRKTGEFFVDEIHIPNHLVDAGTTRIPLGTMKARALMKLAELAPTLKVRHRQRGRNM